MTGKGNDPVALWQQMLGEMEKGFNAFANQAMSSPEFSKALNQAGGAGAGAQKQFNDMFVAAGEALAGDAELRAEINQGLVAVLRSFIADQKSGVSTFISDQVKSWDMAQLISLIEINIGRDLQYIRFNGSLIGGLAGLVLYTAEFLLRLL